ncbi:hypothetical protein GGR51DRAFT_523401 [Nemania sp. FL0031]|nr:hypothetical protein GGR51DRAFT_523401 [Nemania sp. FL0031]
MMLIISFNSSSITMALLTPVYWRYISLLNPRKPALCLSRLMNGSLSVLLESPLANYICASWPNTPLLLICLQYGVLLVGTYLGVPAEPTYRRNARVPQPSSVSHSMAGDQSHAHLKKRPVGLLVLHHSIPPRQQSVYALCRNSRYTSEYPFSSYSSIPSICTP